MAVDTNVNQFKPGKAVGDIALNFFGAESIISVRYNPNGTGNLIPGETIRLVDLGASDLAGDPIVDKRTTEVQAIFGTVRRSLKQATFAPGDTVEVAIEGAVMYLKAAAALTRGVKVSGVVATPGSVQAIGTKAYLGYTLDKAGIGDIIRIYLKNDAVTAGTT